MLSVHPKNNPHKNIYELAKKKIYELLDRVSFLQPQTQVLPLTPNHDREKWYTDLKDFLEMHCEIKDLSAFSFP